MHTLGIKNNYAPRAIGVKHNRAPHTMGTKTNTVIRLGNASQGFVQESGLDTRENLDAFDPLNVKPQREKAKKSNLEK